MSALMATGQTKRRSDLRELVCNTCGYRIFPYANFCSSCGAVIAISGAGMTVTLHANWTQGNVGEQDFAFTIPERSGGAGVLLAKGPPNVGGCYVLESELTRAGRHPDNDIFLDDVTVSKHHAEFVRQGARYLLRDVCSLNGTYANRVRVEKAILSSGDEVQIGRFKLVFVAFAGQEQRRFSAAVRQPTAR
ncbi:MAG: FHA domain-containing protein [Acidimicrobiales bacterium]